MKGTLEDPLFFEDSVAWRKWLGKNHDRATEVWILTYKVHTGKKCMRYREALDEALCYGWIDSRVRRIDDERHLGRWVPRRPDSIWSLINRRNVERLIKEGRMTRHGLEMVEAAKGTGEWERANSPSRPPRMPSDLKAALVEDKVAWKNFQGFARSYRTMYIYSVILAKRKDTRERRIRQVVERSRLNKKPYVP